MTEHRNISMQKPLFVDLDGCLVRSDTLFECLVQMVKGAPWLLLWLPLWLLQGGKALLKKNIADRTTLDVSILPFTPQVLALIKTARAQGRRVILATATHEKLAHKVADHLGCFDDVIATTDEQNLRGRSKLSAIQAYLGGSGEFAYIGNDSSDQAIWQSSSEALIVNGNHRLTEKVKRQGGTSLGEHQGWIRPLLKGLRPQQWVKNFLLFVPLFFAHQYMDLNSIFSALLGFIAFSFCASGTYLLNDMFDIENDRKHPEKHKRPFAAATLPLQVGIAASGGFILAGLIIGLLLPLKFLILLVGYLVITCAYSFRLKRVIMMDVVVLAGLYTIRIIAGAEAIDVPLSFWLLAFSMFLFLSLALVKRFSEVSKLHAKGGETVNGRGYVVDDRWVVSQLGTASGLISVMIMALYVNSHNVVQLYSNPRLIWLLCPLFMYWIGRIWLLATRGEIDEDPVVFAARDRRTWLVGAACVSIVLLAV